MVFFAGILVVSSANLIMESDGGDHSDSDHLENNTVLKIAKWMCDSTDYYDGENFFTLVSACVFPLEGARVGLLGHETSSRSASLWALGLPRALGWLPLTGSSSGQ